MEKTEYTRRIETLGYKASDELVTAVQLAHDEQLNDGLIDQAYADFRRQQKKPLAANGESATSRRGRPPKPAAATPADAAGKPGAK